MTKHPMSLEDGDVGAFTIYGLIVPSSGWSITYNWWEVAQELVTPQSMTSHRLTDGDVVEDVHNVLADVWALGWKRLRTAAEIEGQDELPF